MPYGLSFDVETPNSFKLFCIHLTLVRMNDVCWLKQNMRLILSFCEFETFSRLQDL